MSDEWQSRTLRDLHRDLQAKVSDMTQAELDQAEFMGRELTAACSSLNVSSQGLQTLLAQLEAKYPRQRLDQGGQPAIRVMVGSDERNDVLVDLDQALYQLQDNPMRPPQTLLDLYVLRKSPMRMSGGWSDADQDGDPAQVDARSLTDKLEHLQHCISLVTHWENEIREAYTEIPVQQ